MLTIQKCEIADCDGSGYSYAVCDDNDISTAYEYFDTLEEAELAIRRK